VVSAPIIGNEGTARDVRVTGGAFLRIPSNHCQRIRRRRLDLPALEHLGNGECRFPVSQTKDGEHLFCGQPIERGSYCACHRFLACQPVSPSKARGILRAVR
jgi:hypothetical protein